MNKVLNSAALNPRLKEEWRKRYTLYYEVFTYLCLYRCETRLQTAKYRSTAIRVSKKMEEKKLTSFIDSITLQAKRPNFQWPLMRLSAAKGSDINSIESAKAMWNT